MNEVAEKITNEKRRGLQTSMWASYYYRDSKGICERVVRESQRENQGRVVFGMKGKLSDK